jgi:hypothetical protein
LHVLLRHESALSLNYLGEGGKPKANSIHTLRKYPLKEKTENMVLYSNIYAARIRICPIQIRTYSIFHS